MADVLDFMASKTVAVKYLSADERGFAAPNSDLLCTA